MKELEQKAREFAVKQHPISHYMAAEAIVRVEHQRKETANSYLAGHAEALRFRTVEEERPPLSVEIVIKRRSGSTRLLTIHSEEGIEMLAAEGIIWHRI